MYSYVGNSPTNYIDPTGHRFIVPQEEDWIYPSKPAKPSEITIKETNPKTDNDSDGLTLTEEMEETGVEIINIDGNDYYDYTAPLTEVFINAGREAEKNEDDLLWFYSMVNHEAAWDIKRQKPWEKTTGTPFPGRYDTEIYFAGDVTTPENLGNNLYGYTGTAASLRQYTLKIGSLYAANLIWRKGTETEIANEKKDQLQIVIGINWYKEGKFE